MQGAPVLSPPRGELGRERMRRLAEIAIACVLLVVTLPLLLFVALAIKLESSGPVFARERCVARGRWDTLLTFRTTALDPEYRSPGRQTTRVGQFLRHTRIDVLPRLINVFRGEIGLVDGRTFQSWG